MSKRTLIQMPLRIPPSLHEALKHAANMEGLSLNQYCLYLLARHVDSSSQVMKKKAEELFLFLEEAHKFQEELMKARKQLQKSSCKR